MAENPDEDHSFFANFKGLLDHDCTDAMFSNIEDGDLNPQEESMPIVCDASASSSTIDEANKKTDSSSSSKTGEINKRKLSPNAKPWNPDNFRRPDDETSSLVTQPPYQNPILSDSELSQMMMPRGEYVGLGRSVTQPSQPNQWLNQFPWYHQPNQWLNQWQVTRLNLGSPPFSSNLNNFRTLGMQWQLSRYAALWIPRNTFQSPMIYRAFILGPYRIYVPWRPFPMPFPMMYPNQHPMANQENLYQQRMAIMMMLKTTCRVGDVTMPLFRSELNRQQVLQLEPQTEQPTETQESDSGSSSQYGRDQEQPR